MRMDDEDRDFFEKANRNLRWVIIVGLAIATIMGLIMLFLSF